MRCTEFQRRWQDMLDDRQRPEFDCELRLHAQQCDDCGELLELQEALFQGLVALPTPATSKDFATRTVGRFSAANRRHDTRARSIALVAIGLAACLAAMFYPLVESPPPTSMEQVATVSPVDPPASAAPVAIRLGLDDEVSTWLHELWLRAAVAGRISRLSFQPVEQIAGSFEPLASTLNVALDTLRRSIPAVDSTNAPAEPQDIQPTPGVPTSVS